MLHQFGINSARVYSMYCNKCIIKTSAVSDKSAFSNRIYLQMPLTLLCVCVCVCLSVWMSRIRFAISALIVSPIGSFSSSRRRAFVDTILFPNFCPPPPPRSKNGPKRSFVQYFCRLQRASAQRCSERPRSERAALAGLRHGWLSINYCAQIT